MAMLTNGAPPNWVQSAATLVLVRLFQMIGIPLILGMVFWAGTGIVELKTQEARLDERLSIVSQAVLGRDQAMNQVHMMLGEITQRVDRLEGRPHEPTAQ